MKVPKPNKELVWCKVADIPANTIFMMGPPIKYFFELFSKFGFGKVLSKYFTLFKGNFSQMCYLRHEFDRGADLLTKRMIENPIWALNIIDKVEKWSTEFFKKAKKLRQTDLDRLTDKQLITLYKYPHKYHLFSHGYGAIISWHADAEKERITKALMKMVEDQINSKKLNLVPAVVFSILSTPNKISIVEKEELAFLKIAQVVNKRNKIKKVFVHSNVKQLVKNLANIDKEIFGLINRHYRKYSYIPYQYKGPAYSQEDFLARWQALFREGKSPGKLLKTLEADKLRIKNQQALLKKQLKFNQHQLDLIKLAQRSVFIKDYRKMSLYHGMYCYEPVFKEIGKRLGLSIDQMWAMNYWEIPDALLKGKFDVNDLNARLKECAAYYDGKKYVVLTGKDFKNFIKQINFEKIRINNSKELNGTCASPGKVTGVVKVINLPEDMVKMKQGNVMVAHNTNPNLVPAMKKAAALISEAGGLTCHTAIVARELKIPSVVGVVGADKVLKDGDRIEVDATNGIIKKLK